MAKHTLKVELTEKQVEALADLVEMIDESFEDIDVPIASRNALMSLSFAVRDLKWCIEDECCDCCDDDDDDEE